MDGDNMKCVMILDEDLPASLLANAAAIMGISLGARLPEIVGKNVADYDSNLHAGIIEFPVPILRGSAESIRRIRGKLYQPEYEDITAVDFSRLAQSCKTYDEFIAKMAQTPETELHYLGIAVCGAKKKVSQLTGMLPLLR